MESKNLTKRNIEMWKDKNSKFNSKEFKKEKSKKMKELWNLKGEELIKLSKDKKKLLKKQRIAKAISERLKGVPKSEEHKRKLSETRKRLYKEGKLKHHMLGKHHSKESNLKNSLSQKGEKSAWWGKHHKETTKQKLRLLRLGDQNGMYGKPIPNSKKVYYKGIEFKSTWERTYAKWLDSKGYHWKYEPKRFYYKEFTYLPDFYVKELNSYVEIKGFYRNGDKDKINKFKENNKLIVIEDIKPYKRSK